MSSESLALFEPQDAPDTEAASSGRWLSPIRTAESLLASDRVDGDNEFNYQLVDGERYLLTPGEMEWLGFVRGRYCIAEHIDRHSEPHEVYEDQAVLTIDSLAMGMALSLDNAGMYTAVCLSEDTVLQRIFYHSSVEPDPYLLEELSEDSSDRWKEYV